MKLTTVFFHGLNTYDDDLMHVGPLTFGLMHASWEREFAHRALPFIAVENLGKGSPEEQAARSLDFLRGRGAVDGVDEFCFVGHSVGGLAARVLAKHPLFAGRVRMIITVGTPHHGAEVAELGLEFAERSPLLNRIARVFGYDTSKRGGVYHHFTRAALEKFNVAYPTAATIREVSMICEIEPRDTFWLLRLILSRVSPGMRGDGFISSESQTRGEIGGVFALDHMAELGVFLYAAGGRRRHAQAEFRRLMDAIASLVSKVPS